MPKRVRTEATSKPVVHMALRRYYEDIPGDFFNRQEKIVTVTECGITHSYCPQRQTTPDIQVTRDYEEVTCEECQSAYGIYLLQHLDRIAPSY